MAAKQTPGNRIRKVHTENLEKITSECKDDLEMQMLVLAYIKDTRDEKAGKKKVVKKNDSGSASSFPALEDITAVCGPGFVIADNLELSGKQMKFCNWKKQLVVELFSYCEPRVFNTAVVRVDSLQLAKQLLTFGWDVECMDGSKSDKCNTRKKKDQFERMRQLYMALGSRLRSVELSDGFLDWSRFGHYSLEDIQTPNGREVRVHDKVANKFACVPSEFIGGHNGPWSSKDILSNFHYGEANIKLPSGGEFVLASLFPKVRRELSRRISEELDAVAHGGKPGGVGEAVAGAPGSSGQRSPVETPSAAASAGDGKVTGKSKGNSKQEKRRTKIVGKRRLANDDGGEAARRRKAPKTAGALPDEAPPSPTAADVGAAAGLGAGVSNDVKPGDGEVPSASSSGKEDDAEESGGLGEGEDGESEEGMHKDREE